MPDIKDIAQVAIDAYHGVPRKYSVSESQDTLRQALIDLNNGSTKLDYKAIRDGKCAGLFTLLEEILDVTVIEGLQKSDFFNNLVDFRNVAMGDKPVFEVEDSDLFVVDEAADGTQGIRRQRIGGITQTTIPTTLKVVRIYEELNRVLSGQIDFNQMIAKVSESFERRLMDDIWNVWDNASASDFGGATYIPVAGTYDEQNLITLVAHVEAAAGGRPAKIFGTKVGIQHLVPSLNTHLPADELYRTGYVGKFYGTDVVAIPQRHQIGTTSFQFDDKEFMIVAGDQKPIKCVYEGGTTIINREPTMNRDLTYEYFVASKYGLGVVLAGNSAGVGKYEVTAWS